ncbi:hypothetical protein L7F22_031017 [Adiantum nelumboides]|nr:hypothetical protein [Adiantum nelumboides]
MASPGNVVYAENDRPRMGAIRRSFQKNVLLVKPKLGTTKKPTTDIPDEEWIYGVCNEFDEEGVQEVLVHKENVPDLEKQRGPDILSMNKLAAIRHVPKACQQRAFRKEHLIRLHISRRVGKSPSAKLPSEIDPNYIYGRPGEQDEQMWKVMQHGFADEWIKLNLDHQHEFLQPYKTGKPRSCKELPWTCKATAIYFRNNPESKPICKAPFKLSRFKNVPKKIDNYNPTPLQRD